MMRLWQPHDLAQLIGIEALISIAPWNEETFKICFQPGYFGWVIEINQKIIAFIVIFLNKEECHILNLGVLVKYRHQGYGQKLMEEALFLGQQKHAVVANLEVRKSNHHAIALYKKLKFVLVNIRKDYYPTLSGREDALVFAKLLTDPTIS